METGQKGGFAAAPEQTSMPWGVLAADEDMEKIVGLWMEKAQIFKAAGALGQRLRPLTGTFSTELPGLCVSRFPPIPLQGSATGWNRPKELTSRNTEPEPGPVQHPLLHENLSTFGEQKFCSRFTGEEFFLRDHVVQGEKTLPGVAYFEMARAAVERSSGASMSGDTGIRLEKPRLGKPSCCRPRCPGGLYRTLH